jgi:hypothetical protein
LAARHAEVFCECVRINEVLWLLLPEACVVAGKRCGHGRTLAMEITKKRAPGTFYVLNPALTILGIARR